MTKEYKVGDTIYVKGTVGRTDDTRNPCYVEFGYGVEGWIPRDNIIDELPTAEPVKPVLPKEVTDELEDAKNNVLSFIGYMNTAIENDYCETNIFAFGEGANVNKMIKVLSDAWYNGYTVEKEKKYVLPIPGTDYHNNQMHGNAKYYAVKGTGNWRPDAIALGTDDAVKHGYTVTQSDIDSAPDWVKTITPVEVTDDEQ